MACNHRNRVLIDESYVIEDHGKIVLRLIEAQCGACQSVLIRMVEVDRAPMWFSWTIVKLVAPSMLTMSKGLREALCDD